MRKGNYGVTDKDAPKQKKTRRQKDDIAQCFPPHKCRPSPPYTQLGPDHLQGCSKFDCGCFLCGSGQFRILAGKRALQGDMDIFLPKKRAHAKTAYWHAR